MVSEIISKACQDGAVYFRWYGSAHVLRRGFEPQSWEFAEYSGRILYRFKDFESVQEFLSEFDEAQLAEFN